jgi:hypothetical protein
LNKKGSRQQAVSRAMRAVSGRQAYTKSVNDKGKEKKQQVKPALRLPAKR